MTTHQELSQPKSRQWLLKAFGVLFLLIGFFFAYVGMVEMECFYLFSEGGRFAYEDFGFGTFMFANIAAQIAGYYVIAAIGIVLGAGHLGLKCWARDLALTLSVSWLIVGLPLTAIALLMFATAKDPSATVFLIALPITALVYPVAPLLAIRFYDGESVRRTFEEADPAPSWLASIPLSVRVLCMLLLLNILALHGMVLLNGLFPFFGVLLTGLQGILALDVIFLLLGILVWGLACLKPWAWWATLSVFVVLTVSTLITLPRYTVGSFLNLMCFAPLEMDAFSHLPFLNASPTLVAVLPLLTMLGVIGWAYQHFWGSRARGAGTSQS